MRNIKELARQVKMPYDYLSGEPLYLEKLEAFASLVRADALAQHKPYRLLQDNGSKYFGESWDKPAQPTIPDALTTADKESPEYTQGWNDCRGLMLQGQK